MTCESEKAKVPENETKAIMVSRLLAPEQKAELLEWARLACAAENSVHKLDGFDAAPDGIFARPQECSRGDVLRD